MRLFALTIAAVAAVAATPASAQDSTESRLDNSSLGIVATTPSRIASSRNEMNRGRDVRWAINPTPTQLRTFAERSLRRGGFQCTVADVALVDQLADGTPLVEVACEEDGGGVIADSNPMVFSDCLDLVNATGAIRPCRLPANVARMSAPRS